MEISIWLPSKGGQGRWRGGVRAVGPVAQGRCWDADAAGGQVVGKRQRQRHWQRQIRWGRDKGKYKDRDKKEDRETERRRGETAIVKNMSTFQVIQFETKLAEITIPASKMRDGENRFVSWWFYLIINAKVSIWWNLSSIRIQVHFLVHELFLNNTCRHLFTLQTYIFLVPPIIKLHISREKSIKNLRKNWQIMFMITVIDIKFDTFLIFPTRYNNYTIGKLQEEIKFFNWTSFFQAAFRYSIV